MSDHKSMDSIVARLAGDSGDCVHLTGNNGLKRTSSVADALRKTNTWTVI